MHPRTKFLIGGLVVVAIAASLAYSAIRDTGLYYFTPTELAARVQAEPAIVGKAVKVGARVVPGSIQREPGGMRVQFRATDGAQTYPVSYVGREPVPDTFTDSADVILEGKLGADNTFVATTLLAKCASRFEALPDKPKYTETPGYQAARART